MVTSATWLGGREGGSGSTAGAAAVSTCLGCSETSSLSSGERGKGQSTAIENWRLKESPPSTIFNCLNSGGGLESAG